MDKFEQIKALLASCEDDYQKAKTGNKAAGTRVRKVLQDVRNLAQELRKDILSMREVEQSS